MSVPYSITIGLEIHVQLKTASKMFCACATDFGAPPNTQVCPVCLGLPGTLPVINRTAFALAVRTALALRCEISPLTRFDRKSYYYPDLPKNYQISQYDLPFSHDGVLDIPTPDGQTKPIGIIRVHLEEDAGKLIHSPGGDSLVDLNRTGVPLMEIVTQPDIHNLDDLHEFLLAIRLLLTYLDVSNCNMEEGNIRCDANISVQLTRGGQTLSTPISEIKNMNSFSACERAMAYEAERLYHWHLDTGLTIDTAPKQTRGWDDVRSVTVEQRQKEEASDYRYFPDPDLVPVTVDPDWLDRLRTEIPELPLARRKRFISDFGLSEYDASVLTADKDLADWFERLNTLTGDPKTSANWITQTLLKELNARKLAIRDFPLAPEKLAELIRLVADATVSITAARDAFTKLVDFPGSARELVESLGLLQVSDASQLEKWIDQVMAENTKAVADYRAGKEATFKFLVGQVMRAARGKANPQTVNELLREKLK